MNGRKPGSVMTGTCCKCGCTEPSTFAGSRFLCQACEMERVREVRILASEGLSQSAIGRALGMSQQCAGHIMRKHNIPLGAKEQSVDLSVGITRGPDRLMPTRQAIQMRGIFEMARSS